jgi:hypothetical protein
MNQQRPPWFLGLATAAVLILSRGSSGSPKTPMPAAGLQQDALRVSSFGQGSSPQKNAWAAYVRVYDDFFGTLPVAGQSGQRLRGAWAEQRVDLRLSTAGLSAEVRESELDRIADTARKEWYRLEFLVALVPDPIDSRLPSNFDFTLAGLQMGLNRAHYLFDRGWHPWTASAAAAADSDRPAHQTAGIMLFRREQGRVTRLLAVFLVGETPKGGIHRQAFHQAVTFIARLQQAFASSSASPHGALQKAERSSDSGPAIRVLGPSFSGSAESLRNEMRSLAQYRFRVASGSATVAGLEAYFQNLGERVTFGRTVVPDDLLTEAALGFLEQNLGWDLSRAALLSEGDTAYGNNFPPPPTTKSGRLITLFFPSDLSTIRNAWEESGAGRATDAGRGAGKEPAIGAPKAALEINLADRGTPADSILEISPLTSRVEEMALASLLRTIARRGIRYVGIVATDVKDEIFLAEQVRRWAPDITLVLFESNLIYVHPHFHSALFGSLVVTSFPMLTNEVAPTSQTEPVVQFGNETQKGIFLATQCLLGEEKIERPAVWFAASGNDTLSPVAKQEVNAESFTKPCVLLPKSDPAVISFPEGNDLQLFIVLAVVCVLALWFGEHVYLPTKPSASSGSHQVRTRILLVLGEAVLVTLGAGIVVLALLPIHPRARHFFVADAEPLRKGLHGCLLGITVLAYLYLLYCLATKVVQTASGVLGRRTPRLRRLSVAAIQIATLVSGALVCWALSECILDRWSLGQPGFFYLRARRFANGLSPLVSLAWMGGALFVWISVELRRQQLRERHHLDWPIPDDAEPALSGCGTKLQAIERLLHSTLPASRKFWIWVAVAIVPTAALLWNTTQPLADPQWCGHIFVTLVLVAFVLSVASFYRFGETWQLLRRILGRLEDCRCRPYFTSLAGLVRWNPMQSFVWYTPSFRSLKQSVGRLEELEADGVLPVGKGTIEASKQLKAVFEAEAKECFSDEVIARASVSKIVDQVSQHLIDGGRLPEVQELFALRVVGYLRHVFVQLRYALMGAMAPVLLLIVALNSYTFVPNRFMLMLFWTALLTASAVSLIVFVQMDRDVVLSEIGNRPSGKVTFDRAFLANIFAYALLPLLALVSSQLPEIGQMFGHWLDPLTRLLEVG